LGGNAISLLRKRRIEEGKKERRKGNAMSEPKKKKNKEPSVFAPWGRRFPTRTKNSSTIKKSRERGKASVRRKSTSPQTEENVD